MTRAEKARELQWQAEDDARIMAQYQEIINNKARTNRAIKVANKKANELQKSADNMKKVANKNKKK